MVFDRTLVPVQYIVYVSDLCACISPVWPRFARKDEHGKRCSISLQFYICPWQWPHKMFPCLPVLTDVWHLTVQISVHTDKNYKRTLRYLTHRPTNRFTNTFSEHFQTEPSRNVLFTQGKQSNRYPARAVRFIHFSCASISLYRAPVL